MSVNVILVSLLIILNRHGHLPKRMQVLQNKTNKTKIELITINILSISFRVFSASLKKER